jgi:ABC-2 type transport system ATP-binding protein
MSAQAEAIVELGDRQALVPRSAPGPERLLVEGVTKHWGKRLILDSVDLSLRAGEVAALVGANGVGKTTLLRIVAGLIGSERGTVRIDGIDIGSDRREYMRRLGFVSAGQSGLYARLTAQNHLEYWARIAFVPRKRRKHAIERAVERFELGDLCAQRVERLSMGQRQRVRLAMSFLHEPRLLLFDEPRTSLDAAGVKLLADALSEFLAAGGTAVWCAPGVDDVCLEPARVYTLSDARVIGA